MGVFLGILFAILFIGAVSAAIITLKKGDKGYQKGTATRGRAAVGIVSICVTLTSLVLFIFIPFGFKTVKTGEIGVLKVWGEAREIKTDGLHFTNIVSQELEKYDLRTQQVTEVVEAYSLDAQTMNATIDIQFTIQADKVIEINKRYGTLPMLKDRLKAVALEKSKVVLSSKSAMVLIETRNTLSGLLESAVRENTGDFFVDIAKVVVTDISFNDAFEQAVEQKMIAEQDKLKAQYDKEKAIIKAEEELEVSKKLAEARLAQAKGEADAKLAIAEAEATAIQMKSLEVARALGFTVTETEAGTYIDFTGKTEAEIKLITDYLRYMEYLTVWNGELPTVMLGEDGASIILPTP